MFLVTNIFAIFERIYKNIHSMNLNLLYFLILSVLGFLIWSLDMDSSFLLWSFLAGTFGFAPGCLILAGKTHHDVSNRKSFLDSLTRYMVGVVFAANLIFIPSVRHLLKFDVWGVFSYEIPHRIVMPFGVSISSTTLISIHALLAIYLALLMMIQFLLMMQLFVALEFYLCIKNWGFY